MCVCNKHFRNITNKAHKQGGKKTELPMASSLFYLLLLVQVFSITAKRLDTTNSPRFTAILIFGDSLLDTGNNNFIPTVVKANHKPYGQDFPGKIPTGRFSNGKLVSDLLASALGIKETVPPFLDPNLPQDELRTGVCFASAGSGYDDMTTAMSGVIPVSKQTEYLKQYIEKLKGATGEAKASDIINGSLVLVTSGSNDVSINYFGGGARRLQFPLIGGYHDFLLQRVQAFVKELYNQGCRNVLIAGLPPLGCWAAGFNMGGRCVDYSQSQSYNQKLVALLPQLQESLPGSKLAYADFYTPIYDMMNNPQKYGFTVTNTGCCGLCTQFTPVCPNPSQYLLWDSVHPGEAAYRVVSKYLQDDALPKFS
ncbi:GDSL esterase/lipase At2g30220-like [Rhododendron vialii]|uniref:GDSL esterase/lipase At2g30220-like n=1 Tax=Rhododendron vialii TaxID=182163 RepID=UPI00265F550F|nr:GDSL esterase/lipase At2g30220-like [Rhododendron vialii]